MLIAGYIAFESRFQVIRLDEITGEPVALRCRDLQDERFKIVEMGILDGQINAEGIPGKRVAVFQVGLETIAKVRCQADILQTSLSVESIDPMASLNVLTQDALILLQRSPGDVLKMLANKLALAFHLITFC